MVRKKREKDKKNTFPLFSGQLFNERSERTFAHVANILKTRTLSNELLENHSPIISTGMHNVRACVCVMVHLLLRIGAQIRTFSSAKADESG